MRTVDHTGMMTWLDDLPGGDPVVVSLPDASEVGLADSMDLYAQWLTYAARACLDSAGLAPTVFVQTDRRGQGVQLSKAALLIDTAAGAGVPLRWHKLALRRDPGATDLKRPTYSHVLAFGGHRPGRTFPDVWAPSARLWQNGMQVQVARDIVAWLDDVWPHGPIVNPCCGHGTVLAAANAAGRAAVGCDLDADLVQVARDVQLQPGLL